MRESDLLEPSQVEWCREHIPGFRAMNDQAAAALRDTEEYRQRLGHLLPKPDEPGAKP